MLNLTNKKGMDKSQYWQPIFKVICLVAPVFELF
jgi:hypothetical protein